jgi:hypothetical protein
MPSGHRLDMFLSCLIISRSLSRDNPLPPSLALASTCSYQTLNICQLNGREVVFHCSNLHFLDSR